jgi:hypothetical protein
VHALGFQRHGDIEPGNGGRVVAATLANHEAVHHK